MAIYDGMGVFVLECLDRILVGWSTDVGARCRSLATTLPAPPVLRWVFTQAHQTDEEALRRRLDEWRVHGSWFLACDDTAIELEAFGEQWEDRHRKRARERPAMLKLSEFARYAGVSHKTAWRWVEKGKLYAVRSGSTHWRVPVRQLLVDHPAVYEQIQQDNGPLIGRAIRFSGENMANPVHCGP